MDPWQQQRFEVTILSLSPLAGLAMIPLGLIVGVIFWFNRPPEPTYLKHPVTAEDFLRRCQSIAQQNVPRQAIGDCNTAIKINPNSWEAYFTRGAIRNIGDKQGQQSDFSEGQRLLSVQGQQALQNSQ